jgi:hypothetical protein
MTSNSPSGSAGDRGSSCQSASSCPQSQRRYGTSKLNSPSFRLQKAKAVAVARVGLVEAPAFCVNGQLFWLRSDLLGLLPGLDGCRFRSSALFSVIGFRTALFLDMTVILPLDKTFKAVELLYSS